jgi:hypothetical protein
VACPLPSWFFASHARIETATNYAMPPRALRRRERGKDGEI